LCVFLRAPLRNYISLPVAPPDYDMAEVPKLEQPHIHSKEKLFTIVSCSKFQETKDALRNDVLNVDEY
jgi:aliphatic nitrilase